MPPIIRYSMAASLVLLLSAACLTSRLTCAAGAGRQPVMEVAREDDPASHLPGTLAREVRATVRAAGGLVPPHGWWLEDTSAGRHTLPDMRWIGPDDGLEHLFGGW